MHRIFALLSPVLNEKDDDGDDHDDLDEDDDGDDHDDLDEDDDGTLKYLKTAVRATASLERGGGQG